MVSNIDATKPTTAIAYTADVRANFAAAKLEIEELQGGLGNTINAGDLGIKADGITDNTILLQNIINDSQATTPSGTTITLLLPMGRILTGPLNITGQITIKGTSSSGSVIVLKDNSMAPAITITPLGTLPTGMPYGEIKLCNLRIENQTIASGNTASHGILCVTGAMRTNVILENITIYGMPGDGIHALSFTGSSVSGMSCMIWGNKGYGINANSINDWHFYDCQIAVNGIDGVLLAGCSQCVFVGCNIYSNTAHNLYLFCGAGISSGNHTFTDCMFDRSHQIGVFYDMRGTSGATFKGCSFLLSSQSPVNSYSDVVISLNANNDAMFSGCFWGSVYSVDPYNTEKLALEFQTTTNTVVLDPTNVYADGSLHTNAISQVYIANAGIINAFQGPVVVYAPTQYTGFEITNGTNVTVNLVGYGPGNDLGVLTLLNGGVAFAQLSAGNAYASNFINGDFWLGNGNANATPSNRVYRATDGLGTDIAGAALTLSGGRSTGAGVGGKVAIRTTPAGTSGATQNVEVERMSIDQRGNVVINTAAIATTATDGFLYIPTCNGSPTGVPTVYNGRAPIVFDYQTNKIWIYNAGWKSATIA